MFCNESVSGCHNNIIISVKFLIQILPIKRGPGSSLKWPCFVMDQLVVIFSSFFASGYLKEDLYFK